LFNSEFSRLSTFELIPQIFENEIPSDCKYSRKEHEPDKQTQKTKEQALALFQKEHPSEDAEAKRDRNCFVEKIDQHVFSLRKVWTPPLDFEVDCHGFFPRGSTDAEERYERLLHDPLLL
jgi:hypothetical protein